MNRSYHLWRRLFLPLMAALLVLSGCAAEAVPQENTAAAEAVPRENAAPAGTDAPDSSQDDFPPFHVAVSCWSAWAAVVDWYYAEENRQEAFSLDDLCVQEPLEQCIEGLKTGARDVIVIPWNDEISQELAAYRSLPLFKDAIVFVRSNSENNGGWDLTSECVRQAFTEESTVYWDAERTDPIIPAAGYTGMETEIWQLISRLFGFEASGQVLDASEFDNPVQAVAASGREGSSLWPYYASCLNGDMGINGEVISVDGVFPSGETIGDGSYPYGFTLRAVFSSESANDDAILAFARALAR